MPLLRPETLGKLGTKMYQSLCNLGFNEDILLTLAPPPRHIRDANWIHSKWCETMSIYEANFADRPHWALVATNEWSQVRLRPRGSGHVVWRNGYMPVNMPEIEALWRKVGNSKISGHTLPGVPYHRSKVGYWAEHFDKCPGDYVIDFAADLIPEISLLG